MARSSGIRGSRIGAGPMGETNTPRRRGPVHGGFLVRQRPPHPAELRRVGGGPGDLERRGCGLPAGQDRDNPPTAALVAPYKTHLAYVRERRSEADGEILLAEALAKLRGTI